MTSFAPGPDEAPLRARARSAGRAPAICLVISGILAVLVLGTAGVATAVVMADVGAKRGMPALSLLPFAVAGVAVVVGGCEIAGGLAMLRLRTPMLAWAGALCAALAMAGAILCLVPCLCGILPALPLGIWALVQINKPAVREAFARTSES